MTLERTKIIHDGFLLAKKRFTYITLTIEHVLYIDRLLQVQIEKLEEYSKTNSIKTKLHN